MAAGRHQRFLGRDRSDLDEGRAGRAQMTFADIALGVATVDALGGATNCATAQLHHNFARAVRIGSVLVCRPEVVRRTSRLVFTLGLFTVDGDVVGSADAIFNVFEQR